MFSAPAPCVNTSVNGSRRDVNCNATFKVLTASCLFWRSNNAAVAATAGEAMLVPDSVKYSDFPCEPGTRSSGNSWNRRLPFAASETMLTPGASRSGLASKSNRVGPRELESADGIVRELWRSLGVE